MRSSSDQSEFAGSNPACSNMVCARMGLHLGNAELQKLVKKNR